MPHIRVKICGVTTPTDAAFAADCGADALGVNFYPKSPRFLTLPHAQELLRAIPPFTSCVGVFVTDQFEDVRSTSIALGLRAVQTYSAEPPLASAFFPSAHVPAFRVKDSADLDAIRRFVSRCQPAAVLVDSYVAGEMGGTGHQAPWHLLAGFDPGVPLILAGGLTPDNVAEAIRLVKPWGVDVASGVESAPGRKDPDKVRAFVQAVRTVAAEFGSEPGVAGLPPFSALR